MARFQHRWSRPRGAARCGECGWERRAGGRYVRQVGRIEYRSATVPLCEPPHAVEVKPDV